MKLNLTIFAAVLVWFTTSCNNTPAPAPTPTPGDTVTVHPTPPPAFMPYKAIMVSHTVKDFDKWLEVFKANDSIPKTYGLSNGQVGRGLDNDKLVLVFNKAADIQRAKDFSASPELKNAMKKAGVTSKPDISYAEILRDDTTTIPQAERVMVTSHVKDFDAWLKAYDAEGKATRASFGLIDRGLARGVDDTLSVTLVFAITDMAKAKARIASPELKKIMSDAGVVGPPQITYFKWIH